jgi:hypothetical protein
MGMGGIMTLPYRRSCLTDVRKIVKPERLHRSVGVPRVSEPIIGHEERMMADNF